MKRAIAACFLVAATVAAQPSVKLPPALDRVLRDYEAAWRAHDPNKLASLFSEDGYVLSPRKPPVRGRASIRETYAKSGGPLDLRAIHYETSGNVGYIIGEYGYGDQKDVGKFVLALKKVNGRWMIAADIDNGNAPPPAAKQ